MSDIDEKLEKRFQKISLLTRTTPLSYTFSFDKIFVLYGSQEEATRVADIFCLAECHATVCQINAEFLLTVNIEKILLQ